MDYSIERIAGYACHLGEGPVWHGDEQRLYWLDILQGRIYRYDPQTGRSDLFFGGDVIGGMTIQENGQLLLFMEAGHVALLQEGRLTTVVEKIDGEAGKRFNDVIATPSGAVFCGTLSYAAGGTGTLYHLSRNQTIRKVVDGVGIANGMGFSPDLAHFYFTDSVPARTIYRFRYEQDGDSLYDETVFAEMPAGSGLPDGLTVDAEGYIWSARWDGGRVTRFAPSGDIDCEIPIPGARKVSSVAFGGPGYSDLYVTTAGGDAKSENGENAGALFCIHFNGLRGRPEYRSRIEVTS